MSEFIGFPARMEYTPVPNIFLSNLLPEITDIAELRVMLHAFRLLYFKKGILMKRWFSPLITRRTYDEKSKLVGRSWKAAVRR